MNRAIFIKHMDSWRGEAKLYRLVPPPFHCGRRGRFYVVVSAADLNKIFEEEGFPEHLWNPMMVETYIFRTTRLGKVLRWEELPGSFKGGMDHRKALMRMGYHEL